MLLLSTILILLLPPQPTATTTTAATTTAAALFDRDQECSYRELVERKREAVKIQLLAKLRLTSLPTNVTQDSMAQEKLQSARAAFREEEMMAPFQGDSDNSRVKSTPYRENMLFPESRVFNSSCSLLRWDVPQRQFHPGTTATLHLGRGDSHRHITVLRSGRALVSADVTQLWKLWTTNSASNEGLLQCGAQSRPFIVVRQPTGGGRRSRQKRYSSQTCTAYPNRCCYKPHEISFAELGLDATIVEPKSFNAGLCLGECGDLWLEQHYHSLVTIRSSLCCAPARTTGLKVLMLDGEDFKIVSLQDMLVTECGCK